MSSFQIESNESVLIASIELPASKSISNRALILNAVRKQIGIAPLALVNLSEAEDTVHLINALANPTGLINIDNAGTSLRFLCAYFAATPGIEVSLTGNQRMKQRPIQSLVRALQQMGAEICYLEEENVLPIKIIGKKLSGGEVEIEAHESSQFSSALLLIAPLLAKPLSLKMKGELSSLPYIKMSLAMLHEFGFTGELQKEESTLIATQQIKEISINHYAIEADWSSAAFFYEAALLADKADILLKGLRLNTIQGDGILHEWMLELGIKSIVKEEGIYITKGKEPETDKFSFDFTNCPDLAPAIICATAAAGYRLDAIGLSSLQHKESKRLTALQLALENLAYKVQTKNSSELKHDGLQHHFYQNKTIETYEDHRLCMAFAMFAVFQSRIKLSEVTSVKKSFPNFWEEAAKIGLKKFSKN